MQGVIDLLLAWDFGLDGISYKGYSSVYITFVKI
jgi:hypothetical protein